mmetsp:Transcript_7986/g.8813  ORF Transcript_7986/g.8813 Transcript_7986/m.8813 type:complete len:463 (-) Transcript_7986:33-1421(-)
MSRSLLLFIALCGLIYSQKIDLPDYKGPELTQYSGYIQVNTTGRFIHYWLIESENDPENAPLVLWTNGGPGCSGVIGLMREMGPFRVRADGTLGYTDVAWTQVANMLFIEQPAGVGYSYYTDSKDRSTSDVIAAEDNFAFLQGFLEKFPKYNGRKTWLTAESYGGVYIPMLTRLILQHPQTQIAKQFEGVMIGNPTIRCDIERAVAEIPHLFYHGLISYGIFSNWTKNNCAEDYPNSVCGDIHSIAIGQVGKISQPLKTEFSNFPSLNTDALYYDFCTGNGTLQFSIQDPNGCKPLNDLTSVYLSRKDVQEALNVKVTGEWSPCFDLEYNGNGGNMIDVYRDIFKLNPALKVLIYSGDVDMLTVPHAHTQACLATLDSPVETKWQPWFVNGETVGYVEKRAHFTYATIKGAGHEAPQYQPLSSLAMFTRFLNEGKLTGAKHDVPVHYTREPTQSDFLKRYQQ